MEQAAHGSGRIRPWKCAKHVYLRPLVTWFTDGLGSPEVRLGPHDLKGIADSMINIRTASSVIDA